jgi:hypothetical protein
LGGDGLSDRDRLALRTLEQAMRATGLMALWRRSLFRLVAAWGARLAMSAGVVIMLVALAIMWLELSTHVVAALASEVVLTAGTVLFGHGLRLWWRWRLAKRALSRGSRRANS